jgi:hypothetical protein
MLESKGGPVTNSEAILFEAGHLHSLTGELKNIPVELPVFVSERVGFFERRHTSWEWRVTQRPLRHVSPAALD